MSTRTFADYLASLPTKTSPTGAESALVNDGGVAKVAKYGAIPVVAELPVSGTQGELFWYQGKLYGFDSGGEVVPVNERRRSYIYAAFMQFNTDGSVSVTENINDFSAPLSWSRNISTNVYSAQLPGFVASENGTSGFISIPFLAIEGGVQYAITTSFDTLGPPSFGVSVGVQIKLFSNPEGNIIPTAPIGRRIFIEYFPN